MMQAGIFTGYFPYGLEETAKKIRNLDFNTVQLDLHFKDVDLSAGQITKEKAKKVRKALLQRRSQKMGRQEFLPVISPTVSRRPRRKFGISTSTRCSLTCTSRMHHG